LHLVVFICAIGIQIHKNYRLENKDHGLMVDPPPPI